MNVSDFESQDTLRIAIRRELDSLQPGEILTTRNLVSRVMARCEEDLTDLICDLLQWSETTDVRQWDAAGPRRDML